MQRRYTVTLSRRTRFTGRPIRERLPDTFPSKAAALRRARRAVRDPLAVSAAVRCGRAVVATVRTPEEIR